MTFGANLLARRNPGNVEFLAKEPELGIKAYILAAVLDSQSALNTYVLKRKYKMLPGQNFLDSRKCVSEPVWKNFMALASAKPDCLVASSGSDYKTWSGAGQNCNVFVRSAAGQRLANHKPQAA